MLRASFERAGKDANDAAVSLAKRQQAIDLLGFASPDVALLELPRLLTPQVEQSLQRRAVLALGRHTSPQVPSLLLARWRSLSPTVQNEVLTALVSRTSADSRFVVGHCR